MRQEDAGCLQKLEKANVLKWPKRASPGHTSDSSPVKLLFRDVLCVLVYDVCLYMVCVHAYIHVCKCGHMHTTASMWTSEENPSYWSLPFTLFKVPCCFTAPYARLASPRGFQEFSCLCFISLYIGRYWSYRC